jgi:hypothetical protein
VTSPLDIETLRVAVDAYDRADAECVRLAAPDDHGSGERTARLAGLAAWEAARLRALDAIEVAAGTRDVAAVRALIEG